MAQLQSEVLVALRRIMRATSLHSRKLGKSVGLTVPQLVVIRAIGNKGLATASEVARAVSLSQATVTTILNRLEERQLLTRERSTEDRRRVKLQLTDAGETVFREAPLPLQDTFSERFDALPYWEQHQIVAALTHVAEMMDAEDIDAAPLLDSADLL
ncbi:MAG: MarR family transcriptional regulator [Chromatocurvus sp.]